jgi:hypothetical protein
MLLLCLIFFTQEVLRYDHVLVKEEDSRIIPPKSSTKIPHPQKPNTQSATAAPKKRRLL